MRLRPTLLLRFELNRDHWLSTFKEARQLFSMCCPRTKETPTHRDSYAAFQAHLQSRR
jgi:hypothetical protein